jgi:predicted translin family RNA/ssDNA-binding protein
VYNVKGGIIMGFFKSLFSKVKEGAIAVGRFLFGIGKEIVRESLEDVGKKIVDSLIDELKIMNLKEAKDILFNYSILKGEIERKVDEIGDILEAERDELVQTAFDKIKDEALKKLLGE